MRNRYKKYVFLGLLIVSCGIIITLGLTYGKYVSNSVWNYYLKSKGFYFTSEQLSTTTTKNVNNLWNGGSVNFSIKNNLNQSIISNYDINYEVICTINGEAASHLSCDMNSTGTNRYEGVLSSFQKCINNTGDGVNTDEMIKTECELNGYEYIDQIATKDLYFDIVKTNNDYEIKDVVVNVTVNSTAPYRKTLIGEFTLHKINEETKKIASKYQNYTNYDRLIISNSFDNTKCIKVTWDSTKLLIDSQGNSFSSYVEDINGYIKEFKLNIPSKTSLNFIFYKKNSQANYDINEFHIIESTEC